MLFLLFILLALINLNCYTILQSISHNTQRTGYSIATFFSRSGEPSACQELKRPLKCLQLASCQFEWGYIDFSLHFPYFCDLFVTQIREVLLVEIVWTKTQFNELQNILSYDHYKFLLICPIAALSTNTPNIGTLSVASCSCSLEPALQVPWDTSSELQLTQG